MSTTITSDSGTPLARLEFAQRLRELRVPRGYRTARSLARALEIDENRYTRYERAEVEPDLSMIRKICETLGVTPDALLSSRQMIASPTDQNGSQSAASPIQTTDLQTSAWLLAEAATDLLGDRSPRPTSKAEAALASVTETCKIYNALVERPFEAISELLSHSDVRKVDLPTANMLRDSIDQFVSIVKLRG